MAKTYIFKHLWKGTSTAVTISEDQKRGIIRFKILSRLSNRVLLAKNNKPCDLKCLCSHRQQLLVLCRYLQSSRITLIIRPERWESLTNWGHVTQDLGAINAHPIER